MSIPALILIMFSIFSVENNNLPDKNSYSNSNTCDLEVTVQIVKKDNATLVEINVKENSKKLEYYFSDKERNLLNDDLYNNELLIKEKGDYFCVVVQDNTCHKKIDFKI